MATVLSVRELSKTFVMRVPSEKTIRALERVAFDVDEGEIVAITGTSGSGKSTLIKCLYRTYLATAGRISYRSRSGELVDLASANDHRILALRATELAYCSQQLHVIPRVPALHVVAGRLRARRVPADEALQAAGDCFDRLALPRELWNAYPATFSGGEQLRVNIARSVLGEPRLLLIDEPTASLDAGTKEAVIDVLLDLKRAGTAIVLATHDERTLQRLADRRLEMERGSLRETALA